MKPKIMNNCESCKMTKESFSATHCDKCSDRIDTWILHFMELEQGGKQMEFIIYFTLSILTVLGIIIGSFMFFKFLHIASGYMVKSYESFYKEIIKNQ